MNNYHPGEVGQELERYDSDKIQGYQLPLSAVKSILNKMKGKTLAVRKNITVLY